MGTNNGIFTGTYSAGEVGNAFTVLSSGPGVRIPASATLNVGTNAGFTIEGWALNYDNSPRPLFEWGFTNVYGVHVWLNWPAAGAVYANVMDTNGGYHNFNSSGSLFGTVPPLPQSYT